MNRCLLIVALILTIALQWRLRPVTPVRRSMACSLRQRVINLPQDQGKWYVSVVGVAG